VSSDSTAEQYMYRDPPSQLRGYGVAGALVYCFADAALQARFGARSTRIGADKGGVHAADDNQ